ncbi:MAG: hypothetical protein LBF84_03345 [Holosporales bacterium]|jgi:hypothetical protein|nr:hypothetical protein [Holosporales bacterium]
MSYLKKILISSSFCLGICCAISFSSNATRVVLVQVETETRNCEGVRTVSDIRFTISDGQENQYNGSWTRFGIVNTGSLSKFLQDAITDAQALISDYSKAPQVQNMLDSVEAVNISNVAALQLPEQWMAALRLSHEQYATIMQPYVDPNDETIVARVEIEIEAQGTCITDVLVTLNNRYRYSLLDTDIVSLYMTATTCLFAPLNSYPLTSYMQQAMDNIFRAFTLSGAGFPVNASFQ